MKNRAKVLLFFDMTKFFKEKMLFFTFLTYSYVKM